MPAPLFFSSGDLIADRRYDFASDLQLRGDLDGAKDILIQAVELAPGFASAWFKLGDVREQLGEPEDAIIAYRRAVAADESDHHGAKLRLIRLGAEPMAEMTPGYVRALFDQYAPRFDRALREHLEYRGPEILRDAIIDACQAFKRVVHFRRALDLGCGTGLAADALATAVDEFIGVDLSTGMLAKAKARNIYSVLKAGDMLDALKDEAAASVDLVLAADAFVYVGDLVPISAETARVLRPKGMFAFTVETHAGEGAILGAPLRYAHAGTYLRDTLTQAGMDVVLLREVSTRIDAGVRVPGLVVVAAKV
jgi:predicted TPR repeat methyltransferase